MAYFPDDIIDNDRNTLDVALIRTIRENQQNHLDIATGYFAPKVWNLIGDAFTDLVALRLLLGELHRLEALLRRAILRDPTEATRRLHGLDPARTRRRLVRARPDLRAVLWDERAGTLVAGRAHRIEIHFPEPGRATRGRRSFLLLRAYCFQVWK